MPSKPKTPEGETVPNQVFIGCPWKSVRAKFERAITELRKKYPLSFVIVGRNDRQDAEDLLKIIRERLFASSYAIFDASGGNANVSLEYGLAEVREIPRALYLCTHGASSKPGTKDAAIIADLAGKKRNHYKQEPALRQLLADACREHPYTIRFERFLHDRFRKASKGGKKSARALALKVIHALDGKSSRRRADVVQELLADLVAYKRKEVDQMILHLHQADLIYSVQGPYSTLTIL